MQNGYISPDQLEGKAALSPEALRGTEKKRCQIVPLSKQIKHYTKLENEYFNKFMDTLLVGQKVDGKAFAKCFDNGIAGSYQQKVDQAHESANPSRTGTMSAEDIRSRKDTQITAQMRQVNNDFYATIGYNYKNSKPVTEKEAEKIRNDITRRQDTLEDIFLKMQKPSASKYTPFVVSSSRPGKYPSNGVQYVHDVLSDKYKNITKDCLVNGYLDMDKINGIHQMQASSLQAMDRQQHAESYARSQVMKFAASKKPSAPFQQSFTSAGIQPSAPPEEGGAAAGVSLPAYTPFDTSPSSSDIDPQPPAYGTHSDDVGFIMTLAERERINKATMLARQQVIADRQLRDRQSQQ